MTADRTLRRSPWLLRKPIAIASANGTRKETPEVVGSNPVSATRHRWFSSDRLGDPTCPYIRRWILDLGPLGSIRLHHWYSGDDNRALHDHPWPFLTLVLRGSYTDVSWPEWVKTVEDWSSGTLEPCKRYDQLRTGSIRWRPAQWAHTVETTGAWTLLWTGPKERYYGFWIQRGRNGALRWWKHNRYHMTYGHPPCS